MLTVSEEFLKKISSDDRTFTVKVVVDSAYELTGATIQSVTLDEIVNSTDTLEVKVELSEEMFSDTVGHIEKLRDHISGQIKSVVGVQAKVTLVPPKSIPRSEGKAKRVKDLRSK